MHYSKSLAIVVIIAALTACGSDEEAPGAPPSAAGPSGAAGTAANSRVAATAAEVAKEARGKVQCPAKITSPPRAADAPVDDVVGVRPGMTYEEAANVVMCTNDLMVVGPPSTRGFQIQTYGQTLRQGFKADLAEDRINKSSKEIMAEMQDRAMARSTNRAMDRDAMRGKSWWYVGTMGMPGQERVISAAREEWFADGKQPTMDSVRQALLKKYGTPTDDDSSPGADGVVLFRMLNWAYDPFGRLITETSPLYGRCLGNPSPGGNLNLSPDCGLVVAAQLNGLRENPALVESMAVGVVDQANGYEAVSATEQGFEAMEQARRAKEAEDAASNADAPVL